MTLRVVARGQGMTPLARADEAAMEGVAACDEGIATAQQIALAAANGAPAALIVNLCHRLAYRLGRCRAELLRLGDGGRAA